MRTAFSVAGPTVWNSLPDPLRDPAVNSEQFRRDLKTYLFAGHSNINALEVLRNRALQIDIYLLTYLLIYSLQRLVSRIWEVTTVRMQKTFLKWRHVAFLTRSSR